MLTDTDRAHTEEKEQKKKKHRKSTPEGRRSAGRQNKMVRAVSERYEEIKLTKKMQKTEP